MVKNYLGVVKKALTTPIPVPYWVALLHVEGAFFLGLVLGLVSK